MKRSAWRPFPYSNEAFRYAGGALKKHWDRLHQGDRETYPGAQYLAKLCEANEALLESIPHFDGNYAALSERVVAAWRLYHAGEFAAATEAGLATGPLGYTAANKASAIYAHYLEPNKGTKLKLFQEIAGRSELACKLLPDAPNAHYLYANALGRYSQCMSVLEALAQGLGTKVKQALERTLKVAPGHAEAHVALGTYHAEVVSKVGAMLAGLTYGASKEEALAHFKRALALHPQSAIARIEFANGLLLLGERNLDEATHLYIEASKLEPCDAMEKLDIEFAKSRLEKAH
ncbi:MAG TPA: hypothetical protein VFB54_15595 [Burkholderiales bacterium]|nr:hypothetical protein [Burkholderiales bacterium]